MAFVAFVSVGLTFGPAGATTPLLYGAVVADLGWSVTEATLLYTYKNIASALATLFLAGPLIVRFGLRRVMIAAFVVTAIGLMSFLAVRSAAVYYLAGATQGIGLALTLVCANVLVSRWFFRNQGIALGLALAGISAGGTVFPLLAAPLIEWAGWRAAMALLSLAIWLVALPSYLWLARESPSREELAPEIDDGPAEPTAESAEGRAPVMELADIGGSVLARPPVIWRIALALLLIAIADIAVVQHMPLILEQAGFDTNLAALGLSLIAAFGIVGKVVAGKCYDRFSIQGVRAWYLLVAVSIALILPVAGLFTLCLFASIRGIAHGGLFPMPAVLARHCYGPRLMEGRVSLFLGIWMIGAGVGPVALSLVREATGDYRYGLTLLILLSVAAAVSLRRVGVAARRDWAAQNAGSPGR